MIDTLINGEYVEVSSDLIKKYDRPGPRYTSYPTAPVWQKDFEPKHQSTKAPKHLSLYIHIPFCEHRCNFCGCSTIATVKKEIAEKYIDALKKEIRLVSSKLGNEKQKISQLHIGGGTPTYLSPFQIKDIWKSLNEVFQFESGAEISIELDPRATTDEHLLLLKELGFNRLSLGVQDFSKQVQEAIGRIQPFQSVERLVTHCRKLGFRSLNFDLVYGLPFQTKDTFKVTIKKVIELSPDRIACFNFAFVPWMMPHQKRIEQGTLPKGEDKFAIFCKCIEQLSLGGYDFIGMDHFAKKSDEMAVAAKKGTLTRNFQGYSCKRESNLIAFGLTAISEFADCYAQNTKNLAEYFKAINSGKTSTVKGWTLSQEDIRRRNLIRNLFCNGNADIGNVKIDQFKINELVNDGLIKLKTDTIEVTKLGRLFVRNIAMIFDEYLGKDGKFSRTV